MQAHEMDRAFRMVDEALAKDSPAVLPSSLIAKCCACGSAGPSVGIIEIRTWVGGRGHVQRLYCATWAPAETIQGIDFPAQWVYDADGCEERQGVGA